MFQDREEAALKLAKKLDKKIQIKNAIVLSLVRGGVVIGKVISTYLDLPLDILVLKKIGDPQNKELAIGVIGPKKTIAWNEDILSYLNLSEKEKNKLKKLKEKEREKQEKLLKEKKSSLDLKDKTVILVDDGVATGATVICASKYLKKEKVKKVILAVPVISRDTLGSIKKYFDNVFVIKKPRNFLAVGQFYRFFPQVTNDEVKAILS